MMDLLLWHLLEHFPDDYNLFVFSLLLKDDLDKLTVQNVFVCKDNQHRRYQDDPPAVGSALAAVPATCTFFSFSGYSQDVCGQYAHAKDQFLKNRKIKGKNKFLQQQQLPSSGYCICVPGHRVCWCWKWCARGPEHNTKPPLQVL